MIGIVRDDALAQLEAAGESEMLQERIRPTALLWPRNASPPHR
jgi:hypothetical protein